MMMNSGAEKLKHYSYWSSSCAHRVKIALPLKGLDYEYKPVNLLKGTCLKKKFRSFKVTGESTKNNNSFIRDSMTTNSGAEKLKLYSYWSSSCANRVRIALALKGLDYEYIPVNLLRGDQVHPDFKKINPMGAVPALVDGDVVINDSFAIIMYLDEKYPEPPLLPRDLHKRAINYQAMSIVLSGIQPHKNLATVRFLEEKINAEEKTSLINDAVTKGFAALEKLLVNCAGKHATGDDIYLADLFLAPQIYWTINKFQMNMDPYPTLKKCHESYNELPAFQNAVPEKQPDAPSSTV